MRTQSRSYSELIQLPTFEERFEYLKLNGTVAHATFGYDRYLNQVLYRSHAWKKLRNKIVLRDGACDLGVEGYELNSGLLVHHINPITVEDVKARSSVVFSPNNLITVSNRTHQAIHYGDASMIPKGPTIRTEGDTKLW